MAVRICDRDPIYQMMEQLYNCCDTNGESHHAALTRNSKKVNCGPVPKCRADPTPPALEVSYVRETTAAEKKDTQFWMNHFLSNSKNGKPNKNVDKAWNSEYEWCLCFTGAVMLI